MPKSDDRFYLMEFRNRPVLYGDIGSNLRIGGILVTGGGASAVLTLPGILNSIAESRSMPKWLTLTDEEWSDFIRRSDDPEILIGNAKIFQRKVRYDISGAVQQKVWAADGFECMYCNARMGKQLLTIDHFIPLELGGKNDISNYLTSCKACNKDKGSQHPQSWPKIVTNGRYEWYVNYLRDRKISG